MDIEETIKNYVSGSLYYIYMGISEKNLNLCKEFINDFVFFYSVPIIRNRSRFFAYELKKSIKVN